MYSLKSELSPTFKIIRTFWKNKKKLIIYNAISTVLFIILLLFLPKYYTSSSLISVDSGRSLGTIPSLFKDLPFSLGSPITTEIEKYIALGQSRTVIDSVIEKFNLDSVYHSKFREDTRRKISQNLSILDNDDGTFSIAFTSYNRNLSPLVVNEILSQIKKLELEISMKQAMEFREFIENRYDEVFNILNVFEDSLKDFSENEKIVQLPEQVKQTIALLADLEKQKLSLEIQRDFIAFSTSEKNLTYQSTQEQINIINRKINEIKSQELHSNIALDQIPEKSLSYLRLYRQIKINETIIEYLAPQVESAKIDEKKNFSKLVVVDPAVPLERKSGPKRLRILIILMFLNFILSILYFRLKEIYYSNKDLLKSSIH